jgi:hypothetical protein
MPTAGRLGLSLLAMCIVVALSVLSDTTMTQPFATAKVEQKETEMEALVHTVLEQQGFRQKYSDVVPINQMVDNIPQPMHISESAKSPEMLEKNCFLNQLSGEFDSSITTFKDKKGVTFVDGPVTKWTSVYANAAEDVALQDKDYLKVASSKARLDGMFFYIKTSHTVDVCAYRNDTDNGNTVMANPTLFMPLTKAVCEKSKAAKQDFETGVGKVLLDQMQCSECAVGGQALKCGELAQFVGKVYTC